MPGRGWPHRPAGLEQQRAGGRGEEGFPDGQRSGAQARQWDCVCECMWMHVCARVCEAGRYQRKCRLGGEGIRRREDPLPALWGRVLRLAAPKLPSLGSFWACCSSYSLWDAMKVATCSQNCSGKLCLSPKGKRVISEAGPDLWSTMFSFIFFPFAWVNCWFPSHLSKNKLY